MQAKFYVVKQVSCPLPLRKTSIQNYDQFKHLNLADQNYGIPATIDALFGISIWIKILETGVIKSPDGLAAAQHTSLGWVIYQREIENYKPFGCVFHAAGAIKEEKLGDLSKLFQQFWEVENIPTERFLTSDERECEKIFENSHLRDKNGRYVVYLPFNEKIKLLGRSKSIALKQFFAMERKMERDDRFKIDYHKFIKEYEDLGHLTRVNETKENEYYTPHHGVRTSEKFRAVANSSCKTTTGISLNECQLVGPKLQGDLSNTLMRFRAYEVALTADIVKMFRQIEVHNEHKKYQKFMWRYSTDEPVGVYLLNRVAYGQAAAPYLAVKAMQQCALEYQHKYCSYCKKAASNSQSGAQMNQFYKRRKRLIFRR